MNIRKQTLTLAVAGILASGTAAAEHSRWSYAPVLETDNKATRIPARSVAQSGSAVVLEPRWGYPPVIETVHKARPILAKDDESTAQDAQIALTYRPRWGSPPVIETPHKPVRAKATLPGRGQAAQRD